MKKVIFSLAFLSVLLTAFHVDWGYTYKVAIPQLPEFLDPRTDYSNIAQFIYESTYYPLFSIEKGVIKSVFLDMDRTHSLTANFDAYALCLKKGLRFGDETPILNTHLEASLKEIHQFHWNLKKVKTLEVKQDCLLVYLESPDPNYFEKLTGVNSTIVKRNGSKEKFPVGLGPYRIVEFNNDRIIASATPGRVFGDVTRVEFVAVEPKNLLGTKERIDDWNYFANALVPEDLRFNYSQVKRITAKSYFLFIPIRNAKLRKEFAKCLDKTEFIKASALKLSPIPGLIPEGVIGSQIEEQYPFERKGRCNFAKQKQTIIMANYTPRIQKSLEEFFRKHQSELPVKVETKEYPNNVTLLMYDQRDEVLTINGMSPRLNSAETFLTSFVPPRMPTSLAIPGLKESLEAFSFELNDAKKEAFIKDAHQKLMESGYVLPLGQQIHTYYYPPRIYNVEWRNHLAFHPSLDKIRVGSRLLR